MLKNVGITLLLLLLVPVHASAGTIFLKNGRKIESGHIWEEDGQIKCSIYDAVVGYPKEKVARVESDQEKDTSLKPNELKFGRPNRFKFDIWTFGMTLEQVFLIAQEKNIFLHKINLIYPPQKEGHFDPAVRNLVKTERIFQYEDYLLDKKASIRLSFTPVNQQLFSIRIIWSSLKDSKQFKEELQSLLTDKYGKSRLAIRSMVEKDICWIADKKTSICLSAGVMSFMTADLVYTDTEIKAQAERETQIVEKHNRNIHKVKDGYKF